MLEFLLSMPHQEKTLALKKSNDKEVAALLAQHKTGLTVEEARKIVKLLGRDPTLTEATIWGVQGSEHSSYKSSRRHLKMLPTSGPNVILGPSEDAGIIEIAREPGKKGLRYGIVMSHESHNHPSQVVPYEGAATGVGGCVRDVLCMGAKVIASGDTLRFGELKRSESAHIAEEVISGVGGYGNPIGVANLTGDTYFDKTFNDNCLVNVVTVGVLKEDEIIHSAAPKGAAKNHDIILVGKATDYSGMGGAAFASLQLNEDEKEKNKGAVQEPNPFLKRHIMQSTYALFEIIKEKGLAEKVGFKDLGAGGVMCASVEMVARSGFGAQIDLRKVHTSIENLPPHVIACSETQERMCWIVPNTLTKLILKHYNETWDLPNVAKGARASVIGTVTKGNYVLSYDGAKVCDADPMAITDGLLYNRPVKPRKIPTQEPKIPQPRDLEKTLLSVLSHENIACKAPVYESYDKDVQGITVIEAGDADAGVMAPLWNRTDVPDELKNVGIALKMDANPRYGLIDPYWQAANAVIEGCRNVAAVGATPWCVTDCLNYGNPEKPDQMWELVRGIEGLSDALNGFGLRTGEEEVEEEKPKKGKKPKAVKKPPMPPLPCISGNVSLYNVSQRGAIAPQAVVATLGRVADVTKVITQKMKSAGNQLFLIGPRKNELGGSVYYDVLGELGANLPKPDFTMARKEVDFVTDLIGAGLAESCHDVSDGGLATTVAEMCLGGRGDGMVGAKITITKIGERLKKGKKTVHSSLRTDTKLFTETGGFVVEINRKNVRAAVNLAKKAGVPLIRLGFTTAKKHLVVFDDGKAVINTRLGVLRDAWMNGLRSKL